jgi:peptide/nickel transport system substrate-binding protein
VRTTKRSTTFAALAVGLSLAAAACGSSDGTAKTGTAAPASAAPSGSTAEAPASSAPAPASSAAVETTAVAGPAGGTLTVGAEQEPDCADWINTCGGSSWGYWMMNATTLPRAYDTVADGDGWKVQPSEYLAGEATVVASPKQVVTYKLNPKAVWSTGDPFTSSDFKYTWEQIAGPDAKDVYDATGYNLIESVDDSKPDTAVVTFKTPYAGWKGLFGGGYGIMPSKILTGKDRNVEMKDGYKFSAGPWIIDSWEKGVGITLVPNDKYFGEKPKLEKVVFKFISDTSSEFQAYQAGEVDVIAPQPQIAVIDALTAGVEGNKNVSASTGNVEALWINNSKPPFDSKEVRQALGYSIDRDAIVKRLFGAIGVDKAVQSFNPPILGKYAGSDFSQYKLDLAKASELMTGAGWAKGGDGIWAKGGVRASFALRTTAGNARRELTQEVLIAQLKDAGFEMTTDNAKAGDLFGKLLPAGDYQVALYAQVATFPDPGLSNIFVSTNIPTEANGNTGQNWQRVNVPELDPLLKSVDSEVDEAKRVTASLAADKVLAENAVSLPLDPLPNILLSSAKVNGLKDNPVLGPFFSLNKVTLSK